MFSLLFVVWQSHRCIRDHKAFRWFTVLVELILYLILLLTGLPLVFQLEQTGHVSTQNSKWCHTSPVLNSWNSRSAFWIAFLFSVFCPSRGYSGRPLSRYVVVWKWFSYHACLLQKTLPFSAALALKEKQCLFFSEVEIQFHFFFHQ